MLNVFVMAFVVGGLLAAVFQIAARATKADPPKLLIWGFAIGGVLVPFGVTAWLEAVGGGGMTAMVLDAGGALSGALMSLFSTGAPTTLVLVFGIFVALVLIGCLAGALTKQVGKR